VKTREDIEKRLRKHRERYARKYVEASQQRIHVNCVHNHEHMPSPVPTAPVPKVRAEGKMVPSRRVSLVVLNEDKPICLCMYGSGDPSGWNGDICDSDEVARACKVFTPSVDLDQAKQDFLELMADDEYVFNNYRDVATLQWVLGERVHEMPLTLLERFGFWVRAKLFRPSKPTHLLPPESLSKDLWGSPSPNTPPETGQDGEP
jgi:hypothetical protein